MNWLLREVSTVLVEEVDVVVLRDHDDDLGAVEVDVYSEAVLVAETTDAVLEGILPLEPLRRIFRG